MKKKLLEFYFLRNFYEFHLFFNKNDVKISQYLIFFELFLAQKICKNIFLLKITEFLFQFSKILLFLMINYKYFNRYLCQNFLFKQKFKKIFHYKYKIYSFFFKITFTKKRGFY